MLKAKLIHGYNVKDNGAGSIDTLVKPLEDLGFTVDSTEADYGFTTLLMILLGNKKRAAKLLANYEKGEVLIGHSNGCMIIARAIDAGMPVKRAIFIHPALDNDWEPPADAAIEQIDVFYSERDVATKVASWIPWVRWGNMGTVGPVKTNPVFKPHNDGYRHSEGFAKNPSLYVQPLTVFGVK